MNRHNTETYTAGNIFNNYHKLFVEDRIDVDSKIVTGYLRLNPIDIYKLDFRNQFYIDGHLLRLIKVVDYDAVNPDVTRCEFLKVRIKPPFTDAATTSEGGFNVVMDNTAFNGRQP